MTNTPIITGSGTASGNPASFQTQLREPLNALTVEIQGSQDLHGYDAPWPPGGRGNICPPMDEWEDGYIGSGGAISPQTPGENELTSPYIPISPNTAYTFSYDYTDTQTSFWCCLAFYDSSKGFLERPTSSAKSITATSGATAAYARVSYRTYDTGINPQFEKGSTPTDYVPYSNICPIVGYSEADIHVSPRPTGGTVYSVDLDGTRYVGTLDVVTGELTVTHVGIEFDGSDDESWSKRSATHPYFAFKAGDLGYAISRSIISNLFPQKNIASATTDTNVIDIVNSSSYGGCFINVRPVGYNSMTVAQWRDYLAATPLQVMIELAETVAVQLAGTQIYSIIGQNYVFSDTGAVSLSYKLGYYKWTDAPGATKAGTVFFKRADTFATIGQADVTEYSVPLASATGTTGVIVVVGELTQDYTRQWAILAGNLYYITNVAPQNGLTTITVADWLSAFSRKLVYADIGATYMGGFISSIMSTEFISISDAVYQMGYISVTSSDTTPFAYVPEENGLFTLESFMRYAQSRGVVLSYSISGNTLAITITTANALTAPVVIGSPAQLAEEIYNRASVAKVTVIDTDSTPHDYYLATDGTISTSPPVNRAKGEWVVVKQSGTADLLTTAENAFAANAESHKISFFSKERYALYQPVIVRLREQAFSTSITFAGMNSQDTRYSYTCGEYANTLSEKVAQLRK